MSSEILRRAAALMRERAEDAVGGPWFAFTARRSGGYVHGVTTDLDVDYDTDLFVGSSQRNAVHIASWHPVVALAVADLLDAQAKFMEDGGDFSDVEGGGDANALTVARAYLGSDA